VLSEPVSSAEFSEQRDLRSSPNCSGPALSVAIRVAQNFALEGEQLRGCCEEKIFVWAPEATSYNGVVVKPCPRS
jgi:hypothetical protein